MKCRAAILNAIDSPLVVEEVEIDDPKAGEVLVRLVATGVCHTDVSAMRGIFPAMPPVVLGHEGGGVVEAVGPGVTHVSKGDHVILDAVCHCGGCPSCLDGRPFQCPQGLGMTVGGVMADGTARIHRGDEQLSNFFCQSSFAELAVVPETIVVKVPSELPLETLAPLACGIQTGSGAVLNTARVRPGESVAVWGCGGVGLSAVMAARLAGASPIIAVDRQPSRLALARELGATETINADEADAVAAVQELVPGGVDYAFECIGLAATIRQCSDATRVGGSTVVSGAAAAGSEIPIDAMALFTKNLLGNIEGSTVPGVYVPMLIDFWQRGIFPFDRLLGASFALDDIDKAIASMDSGEVIKPVIRY